MRKSASTPRSKTNTAGPDFDDDIILEILLKLPAKSLIRCRCVCKSWRALISDPSFVQNHLRRVTTDNNNNCNLLVQTKYRKPDHVIISKLDDGDIAITELGFPVTFSDTILSMIYGSCNGLVCAEFDSESEFRSDIIVWNPLTREFNQLPEIPVPEGAPGIYDEGDRYIALAGFGYDSTIQDYKVIRVTKVFYDETALQVFELKTGEWRTNKDFGHISGDEYCIGRHYQGVLLNETLHWIARLRGPKHEQHSMGIVTIGLADEKFQLMSLLPFRYDVRWRMHSMVAVGNSILVYDEFSIWMMKEYGVQESWTQVVYICPEVLPQGFDLNLRLLCILENGEVFLNHREALGLYNPERTTFRNITWTCEVTYPQYVAYVETLVSLLNDICASESAMARTVGSKGARLEALSFDHTGWNKGTIYQFNS